MHAFEQVGDRTQPISTELVAIAFELSKYPDVTPFTAEQVHERAHTYMCGSLPRMGDIM